MKKLFQLIVITFSVLITLSLPCALLGCSNNDNQIRIVYDTRGGDEIAEQYVNENELVILPIPTREDCFFCGWYTSTTWGHRVSDNFFADTSMVLFARWATYQEIDLTFNNYSQYLDISVRYTNTAYMGGNWYADCCNVICKAKDIIYQDGKDVLNQDGKPVGYKNISSIIIKIKDNTELRGYIDDEIWLDTYGHKFWYLENLTDYEKENGVTILNVRGTLRAYLLD